MDAVKANGKLGPKFSVGRGVKQGCPMSVTLFGLFIEMLAHYIDARDAEKRQRNSGRSSRTRVLT